MDKTIVIFRYDNFGGGDGAVVAVFPEPELAPEPGQMLCYAHIGQHGGCCLGWYTHTRPARPAEYQDLKEELEDRGYVLTVRKRLPARK